MYIQMWRKKGKAIYYDVKLHYFKKLKQHQKPTR